MSTVTHHSKAVLVAALALLATGSQPIAVSGAVEEDEELEGRVPTAIELVPSVEAAFRRQSYAPGETAALVVRREAKTIHVQLFRVGPERATTRGNNEMQGVPMTQEREIDDGVVAIPRRRLAVGALLRAPRGNRRPRGLRALRRPAPRARRQPRGGRPPDAHVAGLQPARRRRERQAATPGTATGSGTRSASAARS